MKQNKSLNRFSKKKLVLVICVLFALGMVGEILRETVTYRQYTRHLESSEKELKPGMEKGEVIGILGSPNVVISKPRQQMLYWSARESQGWLLRRLPGSSDKGHFQLAIELDSTGRVARVWGGVN